MKEGVVIVTEHPVNPEGDDVGPNVTGRYQIQTLASICIETQLRARVRLAEVTSGHISILWGGAIFHAAKGRLLFQPQRTITSTQQFIEVSR